MLGVIRPLALAAGLVAAFAAPASAAGWLPAVNLSTPSGTSTAQGSIVASDAAGESFATWYDTDGTNTRIMLATHAPGGPWSAGAPVSDAGQNANTPALSVSPNGFAALAWLQSDGTINRILVARRAPGGAFGAPVILSAPGSDSSSPIVGVDRSGDVQIGWMSTTDDVLHTRRFVAATGTFTAIADLTTAINPSNQLLIYPTLAMSPAGIATIAWTLDTDASATLSLNVQSRTQDANGNWLPLTSNSSTASPTESARPQLAVADDGTVTLVWMEYTTSSCGFLCVAFATSVVRSQTRSPAGTWSGVQTLSDPALISDNPTVAATPDGETTVVWVEAAAKAVKALTRTVGGAFPVASAATIITPQDRAITSGNFIGILVSSLHIAAAATGTVVTFTRTDGANSLASAVYRPAGGVWPNPLTGLATLSATGSDAGLDVNASIDGFGNVVTSWTRANVIQSATLDISPPAFTAISVPASGTTGQPVAMSATTSDVWQALDAQPPNWNFGDGAAAAGGSVSHVFAAAGTYTVTVGASDTAGNAAAPATRQIVISNAPVPPLPATTVAKPTSKITWKAGKLRNSTITLKGTVGGPGNLTITVIAHATRKTVARSTFAATAGAWSRTIKLPSTLAPGAYDVTVGGPVVLSSQTSFTLAAPASGIVKRTYATGPRRGPAVTTLAHTSELWAHFQFSFVPKKGQKITTQWILPGGHRLAANSRPRTRLVEAQVKDLSGKALPAGRWRCVIRVGKVVLATLNVRLK
jgi:PKD repeat protein